MSNTVKTFINELNLKIILVIKTSPWIKKTGVSYAQYFSTRSLSLFRWILIFLKIFWNFEKKKKLSFTNWIFLEIAVISSSLWNVSVVSSFSYSRKCSQGSWALNTFGLHTKKIGPKSVLSIFIYCRIHFSHQKYSSNTGRPFP